MQTITLESLLCDTNNDFAYEKWDYIDDIDMASISIESCDILTDISTINNAIDVSLSITTESVGSKLKEMVQLMWKKIKAFFKIVKDFFIKVAKRIKYLFTGKTDKEEKLSKELSEIIAKNVDDTARMEKEIEKWKTELAYSQEREKEAKQKLESERNTKNTYAEKLKNDLEASEARASEEISKLQKDVNYWKGYSESLTGELNHRRIRINDNSDTFLNHLMATVPKYLNAIVKEDVTRDSHLLRSYDNEFTDFTIERLRGSLQKLKTKIESEKYFPNRKLTYGSMDRYLYIRYLKDGSIMKDINERIDIINEELDRIKKEIDSSEDPEFIEKAKLSLQFENIRLNALKDLASEHLKYVQSLGLSVDQILKESEEAQ